MKQSDVNKTINQTASIYGNLTYVKQSDINTTITQHKTNVAFKNETNTWTNNQTVNEGLIVVQGKRICLDGSACTRFICANSTGILISSNGGMTC